MREICKICMISYNTEEGTECTTCKYWTCNECILFKNGNYYCNECTSEDSDSDSDNDKKK